jgi:hypothetical protein
MYKHCRDWEAFRYIGISYESIHFHKKKNIRNKKFSRVSNMFETCDNEWLSVYYKHAKARI